MEIARKIVTYCDLIKWNNYAIIESPVCIYFCVFTINYFCVSGLPNIFKNLINKENVLTFNIPINANREIY